MAHSPHEEAEHASHHAQDPFDKRVAMSMVVIAALLAMVKVLGHRTHNETLAYRIEAGGATSEASVSHVQEMDRWSFFQAKKLRETLARQDAANALLFFTPPKDAPASIPGPLPNRSKRLEDLKKELTDSEVDDPGQAATKILAAAEKHYQKLVTDRYAPDRADRIVEAEITADRYRVESRAIMKSANAKKAEAETHAEGSKLALEKSEHKHHQALFFDLGELGVELALVLSSIAILTKVAGYWYGGLVVCVAGIASIAMGFFVH